MHKPDLTSLPGTPGIYKFFNGEKKLIYVGKAKNIKKRVSSYFGKKFYSNRKLKNLVSQTRDIKYVITNTEYDALLLENNLIKHNQPKYNILMKDDKTYPYLCIVEERFPRILSIRKRNPNRPGEYFGPYASGVIMRNALNLLHQLFNLRSCSFTLSKEHIARKKFKICLEYHIGNCKAPCVGLQDEEAYNKDINAARNILKGNLTPAVNYLKEKMKLASDNLQFEDAALYKNKLDLLDKFHRQTRVVNKRITEVDVITITSLLERAFVNYMRVAEGVIVLSEDAEVIKKMNESDENILSYAIHDFRKKSHSKNLIVLSNKPIATKAVEFKNIIPQIGEKRKLVELSLKNALYNREARGKKNKPKGENRLTLLQTDLRLKKLPQVIECFDISNFQGAFPVASMVHFVDGRPKKSQYRHYNIKTVIGPNDFASIEEVVTRRYSRLIKEDKKLPDLIIIDGGKGQLNSAYKALQRMGLGNTIPIISIAKKLEEIYYPGDSVPLHIDRRSPGLLLIQRIRNEAHRFAVEFHRLKRGKITTNLETIAGIGNKTAGKLLAHFKSWKKIEEALPEELYKVIGKHKATLLIESTSKEAAKIRQGQRKIS